MLFVRMGEKWHSAVIGKYHLVLVDDVEFLSIFLFGPTFLTRSVEDRKGKVSSSPLVNSESVRNDTKHLFWVVADSHALR